MLRHLLAVLVLSLLAACAGNNRFVLLEEEDGSVGSIVIENEAGAQVVERPLEATRVGSATTAPSEPAAITEQEVEETWGATIRVNPRKPRTFILYFIVGTNQLTSESQVQLPAILESIKEFPAAGTIRSRSEADALIRGRLIRGRPQ